MHFHQKKFWSIMSSDEKESDCELKKESKGKLQQRHYK
jgi:hypothetical protein